MNTATQHEPASMAYARLLRETALKVYASSIGNVPYGEKEPAIIKALREFVRQVEEMKVKE